MEVQKSIEFNKNVVMVYSKSEEFTGYKALEEFKIDNIISGNSTVIENLQILNNKISTTGDILPAVLVQQTDLNAMYDNVDLGGFAGAEMSGIHSSITENYSPYDSIELKYNGANVTGVFYIKNGNLIKEIFMKYNGSNDVTGIYKTNY
jgi:hypothetical protein